MVKTPAKASASASISSKGDNSGYFIFQPSILILFAARAAVGPDEVPLGEWSVVRQRTGGKGEEGRGVGRKLTVTASHIVERRADSYEVRRPLPSNNDS